MNAWTPLPIGYRSKWRLSYVPSCLPLSTQLLGTKIWQVPRQPAPSSGKVKIKWYGCVSKSCLSSTQWEQGMTVYDYPKVRPTVVWRSEPKWDERNLLLSPFSYWNSYASWWLKTCISTIKGNMGGLGIQLPFIKPRRSNSWVRAPLELCLSSQGMDTYDLKPPKFDFYPCMSLLFKQKHE